jgi:hypothetical protein
VAVKHEVAGAFFQNFGQQKGLMAKTDRQAGEIRSSCPAVKFNILVFKRVFFIINVRVPADQVYFIFKIQRQKRQGIIVGRVSAADHLIRLGFAAKPKAFAQVGNIIMNVGCDSDQHFDFGIINNKEENNIFHHSVAAESLEEDSAG